MTDIHPLVQAVYQGHAKNQWISPGSFRLGASQVGKPCDRRLWQAFRWTKPNVEKGKKLRLFSVGDRAEAEFTRELRAAGIRVLDKADNGRQHQKYLVAGHATVKIDALALDPPGVGGWVIMEYKTMAAKYWRAIVKHGAAKSNPEYVDQCQLGMHMFDVDHSVLYCDNKDTSELHVAIIERDRDRGQFLHDRLERIINAPEPPPKIAESATAYPCVMCQFKDVCHGMTMPAVNCRTCAFVTPVTDGPTSNAAWRCDRYKRELSIDGQKAACPSHVFIPSAILRDSYAVTDADEDAGWIEYSTPDGTVRNGPADTASADLFQEPLAK